MTPPPSPRALALRWQELLHGAWSLEHRARVAVPPRRRDHHGDSWRGGLRAGRRVARCPLARFSAASYRLSPRPLATCLFLFFSFSWARSAPCAGQAKARCCADTVAATFVPTPLPTLAPTLCPIPYDFRGWGVPTGRCAHAALGAIEPPPPPRERQAQGAHLFISRGVHHLPSLLSAVITCLASTKCQVQRVGAARRVLG